MLEMCKQSKFNRFGTRTVT